MANSITKSLVLSPTLVSNVATFHFQLGSAGTIVEPGFTALDENAFDNDTIFMFSESCSRVAELWTVISTGSLGRRST